MKRPASPKPAAPKPAAPKPASPTPAVSVADVRARLRRLADAKTLAGMSRYGIPSEGAFGVPVGKIRAYARELGCRHALALALWKTGQYESRMLACFIADPGRVTPAVMDAWAKSFDSWAVCDTACFHLFDRTPHAFAKVGKWARSRDEFVKRAAFALLASVALHDKDASDEPFIASLTLVERAASDERNFVKKGVSWALRAVGRRRSDELRGRALTLAERLAEAADPAARWVGRDALRDLSRVRARKTARGSATRSRAKAC